MGKIYEGQTIMVTLDTKLPSTETILNAEILFSNMSWASGGGEATILPNNKVQMEVLVPAASSTSVYARVDLLVKGSYTGEATTLVSHTVGT